MGFVLGQAHFGHIGWITRHPANAMEPKLGSTMLPIGVLSAPLLIGRAKSRLGILCQMAWSTHPQPKYFTSRNAYCPGQRDENRINICTFSIQLAAFNDLSHITHSADNDAVVALHILFISVMSVTCLPYVVRFINLHYIDD